MMQVNDALEEVSSHFAEILDLIVMKDVENLSENLGGELVHEVLAGGDVLSVQMLTFEKEDL